MNNRSEYTWTKFTTDLSLMTHLTIHEAGRIAYCLENSSADLHPHDVFFNVRDLVRFLQAPIGEVGAERFATHLLSFRKYVQPTDEEVAFHERQKKFLADRAMGNTQDF